MKKGILITIIGIIIIGIDKKPKLGEKKLDKLINRIENGI